MMTTGIKVNKNSCKDVYKVYLSPHDNFFCPVLICMSYLFENEVKHQRIVDAVFGIKNLSKE